MRGGRLVIALAVFASAFAISGAGSASAATELEYTHFETLFTEPSEAPAFTYAPGPNVTQAGSHADVITDIGYNIGGSAKNITTDLPAGFYGSPQSLPFCTAAGLEEGEGYCNPDAQVGNFYLELGTNFFFELPIYNTKSSTEQTAVLEADVLAIPVKFIISVRTDGDYGLRVQVNNVNGAVPINRPLIELWGVPASPRHNTKRCKYIFECGVPSTVPPKPFLTMPTRCEPVVTEVTTNSYENPSRKITAQSVWGPLTGCDAFDFSPSIEARPTTSAPDAPSGLDVDVAIPQSEDPEGLSTAELRTAEVTLPKGLVINPSGGNGLESCSPAQIGLIGPTGQGGASHFAKPDPTCPDASRIGSVEVNTPVLADPMLGSVFVATPFDNPFNSLFAIYATFKGPGLNIKIPGELSPDPQTGQVTTTFVENPQLPFNHFKFNLFGGAFAPLRTPMTCGAYSSTATLTPWSAPGSGPPVTPSDTYAISPATGSKKACPASRSELPNKPSFEGGSTAALAGLYRPFVINLRRDDGTQEFSSVTTNPPPGLVAKLAGTVTCSDAALAAAAEKSGTAETKEPSCPAASDVGQAFAAAGAGPAPYNVHGSVYLAGPYKGAPISLAIVVPATAGPFDLGTVVTRIAVQVDSRTAQLTATSDPIPSIMKGVPLDIRSLSIRLNKPDFTLNPTSCDPTEVTGSLFTLEGSSTPLNNRFQLAECGRLKLKPKLSLSLKGGSERRKFPALTAVLKNRAGDANLQGAVVSLPDSELLAQSHIGTICTRVQFAAGTCPADSVYGSAVVNTPLLEEPLTGPVYLRASDNRLPDLVIDLHGPPSRPLHFEASARIDSIKGGIRNTFTNIPDVPFSKLTLRLPGGKKGLLQNSRNLCSGTNRAKVSYTAHNGLTAGARPVVKAKCPKTKRGKHRKGKRG
jgi:hypothetical protein